MFSEVRWLRVFVLSVSVFGAAVPAFADRAKASPCDTLPELAAPAPFDWEAALAGSANVSPELVARVLATDTRTVTHGSPTLKEYGRARDHVAFLDAPVGEKAAQLEALFGELRKRYSFEFRRGVTADGMLAFVGPSGFAVVLRADGQLFTTAMEGSDIARWKPRFVVPGSPRSTLKWLRDWTPTDETFLKDAVPIGPAVTIVPRPGEVPPLKRNDPPR